MSRGDPLDALSLSLQSGAAELHLVRHADAVPETDAEFAIYDDYEAHPLSEHGRAQAAAVGEYFSERLISAIYASPIRRARETAQAIAAVSALPVEEEPGVREIAIGPLDGAMRLSERLAWLATVAMRDGSWRGIPGTEPSEEVRERMLRAIDTIASRHPGARVAVVSHAGSINAALGAIVGTSHDFVFPLANASVSVVRVGGGRRMLMSANETAHLRGVPARSGR